MLRLLDLPALVALRAQGSNAVRYGALTGMDRIASGRIVDGVLSDRRERVCSLASGPGRHGSSGATTNSWGASAARLARISVVRRRICAGERPSARPPRRDASRTAPSRRCATSARASAPRPTDGGTADADRPLCGDGRAPPPVARRRRRGGLMSTVLEALRQSEGRGDPGSRRLPPGTSRRRFGPAAIAAVAILSGAVVALVFLARRQTPPPVATETAPPVRRAPPSRYTRSRLTRACTAHLRRLPRSPLARVPSRARRARQPAPRALRRPTRRPPRGPSQDERVPSCRGSRRPRFDRLLGRALASVSFLSTGVWWPRRRERSFPSRCSSSRDWLRPTGRTVVALQAPQ